MERGVDPVCLSFGVVHFEHDPVELALGDEIDHQDLFASVDPPPLLLCLATPEVPNRGQAGPAKPTGPDPQIALGLVGGDDMGTDDPGRRYLESASKAEETVGTAYVDVEDFG